MSLINFVNTVERRLIQLCLKKTEPKLCTNINKNGERCNRQIPDDAKYCPGCGLQVDNATETEIEHVSEREGKRTPQINESGSINVQSDIKNSGADKEKATETEIEHVSEREGKRTPQINESGSINVQSDIKNSGADKEKATETEIEHVSEREGKRTPQINESGSINVQSDIKNSAADKEKATETEIEHVSEREGKRTPQINESGSINVQSDIKNSGADKEKATETEIEHVSEREGKRTPQINESGSINVQSDIKNSGADKEKESPGRDPWNVTQKPETSSLTNKLTNQQDSSSTIKEQVWEINMGKTQASYKKSMHSSQCVEVVFHSILHSSLFDESCAALIQIEIKIGKPENFKISIVKKLEDNSFEVEVLVPIPKNRLTSKTKYRYLIVHDSNHQGTPEHIFNDDQFRVFEVSLNDFSDRTVYHQFDGVVRGYPSQGQVLDTFIKLTGQKAKQQKRILLADYCLSVEHFMPQWQCVDDGYIGEEMADRVRQLHDGLYSFYCRQIGVVTEEEFQSCFREAIKTRLKALFPDFEDKGNFSMKKQTKILPNALTVIYLINKYSVGSRHFTSDELKILCKALLPEIQDKKLVIHLKAIKENLPKIYGSLPKALVNFTQTAIERCGLKWLYCVPLIHILFGQITRNQVIPTDVDHDSELPTWWGLAKLAHYNLENKVEKLRMESFTKSSLIDIFEELGPYFAYDYLLPRTIVSCLRLKNLQVIVETVKIPPDIILAKLCHHVKTVDTPLSSSSIKKAIVDCLLVVKQEVLEIEANKQEYLGYSKRSFLISADLMEAIFCRPEEYQYNDEVLTSAVEVFLCSVHQYNEAAPADDLLQEQIVQMINSRIETIQEKTKAWLREKFMHCKGAGVQSCLLVWNEVLKVEIPDGIVKSKFIEFICSALEESLKSMNKELEEDMVIAYFKYCEIFCRPMLNSLKKFVMQVIWRGMSLTFQKWKIEELKRFGELMSEILEKAGAKDMTKDVTTSLQFVLNWKPFTLFFQVFSNKRYQTVLTKKTRSIFEELYNKVSDLHSQVMDRSITVKNLKTIEDHQDGFVAILGDMKVKGFHETKTRKAIKARLSELEEFTSHQTNIKHVIDVFKRLDADTKDLEEDVNNYAEIEDFSLKTLSKTGILFDKPRVNAFRKHSAVLEIAPEIIKYSKGALFLRIWDECGFKARKDREGPLLVPEIIEKVWKPSKKKLNELHKQLRSGDIPFSFFEELCKSFNSHTLHHEFMNLEDGKNPSWVDERIGQMERYKKLLFCGDGASVVIKVKATFNLQGDFEPIERILQLVKNKDGKMLMLEALHHETESILGDITPQKIDCLEKFMNCKLLVDWLKETMGERGLQELKTFVDLAYVATGDDAMSIAKVRCLQSAAIGYAPLIFNLDQHCSYKEFLDRCQEVWKTLESNFNLPQELEDSFHNLEWFKMINRSQGSIEVTSLSQAESVNASGIFSIGYKKKDSSTTETVLPGSTGTQIELVDVLHLVAAEKHEKMGEETSEMKSYNYKQLHDLQSRLMLVAGKAELGKDEVDRFMLILDSMVRLGNVFIKLLSSGCMLFSKFKAEFRCDKEISACASVSFGEGSSMRTFTGKTDEVNKDVTIFIPKIARFLENCLKRWLDFINRKREENHILNFFSIEQMIILQEELSKTSTNEEVSNLVYPLLYGIKPGCTKEDLIAAVAAAGKELKSKNWDIQQDNSYENEIETAKEMFLEKLMEAGFSKALAMEAFRYFTPDQIDEGINWCHEHGEDKNKKLTKNKRKTSISSMSTVNLEGIALTLGKFNERMEKIWEKFLTTVVSPDASDYTSVDHLALILKKLCAGSDIDNVPFMRSFSECGCKEGVPNLIICPQSEIYNTVLSIYSTDIASPLPLPDEVLLCSSQTTVDMLEIFWRRALYSNKRKIHCLVNADLLEYGVSDKGEKSLQKHRKNAESKEIQFKLVVVCSAENEYKSRMVAALDKYRRPEITFGGETHVKSYLSNQLVVENQMNSRVPPASSVDFCRSSVRVVKSWRAGLGKSLYKKKMSNALKQNNGNDNVQCEVTIPLHDKSISIDHVVYELLQHTLPPHVQRPRIFHLDISHEVQEGVDALLFQLIILGCLTHSSGHVWRRSQLDYYIIESMPLLATDSDTQTGKVKCIHSCLDILPDVMCRSPKESLDILEGHFPIDYKNTDLIFEDEEFKSETFQRPYKYLKGLDLNRNLNNIDALRPEGDKTDFLLVLLRHCGVKDPSWSELYHFISFLNRQLLDFETSSFCGHHIDEDLPGFRQFALKLIIEMSRDFATRSLMISEESPLDIMKRQAENGDHAGENIEDLYKMRRTWETSPHAYLFFNPDHHTMTFLGFNVDKKTGNLMNDATGEVLQERLMEPTTNDQQRTLYNGLNNQPGMNLSENFDSLTRKDKILKLCQVMDVEYKCDPDKTYELTTDNVKKILAIYMRFRCDIPVVIMGETGCGKTRLVQFMCSLQRMADMTVKNMIIMKVHGGTTSKDIISRVKKAEQIAEMNAARYPNMYTVLFFDEANTTEAIGVIKEVMCDKSMGGQPIKLHEKLKIIAACNPYRKHKEELIRKLEQAGLGYHVDADKTTDKLGRVPMRRLVYRVQPLPHSMLPLVWDFGQLNARIEEMYIGQMVNGYVNDRKLPNITGLIPVTSKILSECQNFMRKQEDECSFVSLRDVERVLKVMVWFYKQQMVGGILQDNSGTNDQNAKITQALILALGVCYQACLQKREEFRDIIAPFFTTPYSLSDKNQFEQEMLRCQEQFIENVKLADNIARNRALMENVFMMIICIELRIPLFLVGKPGSSKSLAKTIVADAMQGDTSRTPLFKKYKQVQMVSFQCSPLSTPDGIVGTFKQCAEFQKAKDLDRFVSVVVLDEIGLAEDSAKMPLKTLHPLLEDGYQQDEDLPMPMPKQQIRRGRKTREEAKPHYGKVAFIGISNWALDPAKMNRGIFVQREVPSQQELMNSARGICHTRQDEDKILKMIENLVQPLSEGYSNLFAVLESSKQREFFGLRDFYSLVKMVFAFAATSGKKPTWLQLKHAIMRNFGGLDNVDSVEVFKNCLKQSTTIMTEKREKGDPDCSSWGMIRACLEGDKDLHSNGHDNSVPTSETRYLLLLTENYGDLEIIKEKIQTMHDAQVIFGSSFPSDQEYTQVCRNINRIKVCMETGITVILLNLENLYESLYDALNQYYVYYGGQRYVDLGLGSHRVKCKVHEDFRLIVVAEREIVYKKFPIPLINRLEKHIFSLRTMLSDSHQSLAQELEDWVNNFCQEEVPIFLRQTRQRNTVNIGDVFIGYHSDACAGIILQLFENGGYSDKVPSQSICQEIIKEAKDILLWCATPDSIFRLYSTKLKSEMERWIEKYFSDQQHNSFIQFSKHLILLGARKPIFSQITTHSKLLSVQDMQDMCNSLHIKREDTALLTLQSFETEQQFCREIRSFLEQNMEHDHLLIVQCDCGDQNANLIACARYSIQGEIQQIKGTHSGRIFVALVIQLPRVGGSSFSGFQCGLWHSYHIDDLHTPPQDMPSFVEMHNYPISAFLSWNEQETSDVTNDTDKNSNEQNGIGQFRPMTHIDIKDLIGKCVQAALAMVKDQEQDSLRNTERIKILLNLIHHSEDSDINFLNGMLAHLKCMLLAKEENDPESQRRWLSTEASTPKQTNSAGTFRRAAFRCLENKIASLVAGIVAFVDKNRNLSILMNSNRDWQTILWLEFFSDPKLTQIQYSDCTNHTGRLLSEYIVQGTSFEGETFTATFPFSWILYRHINSITKATSEEPDNPSVQATIMKTASRFESTPLGQLFVRVMGSCEPDFKDVIDCYVRDFVYMAYPVKSEAEHQLVCRQLSVGLRVIRGGEIRGLIPTVVSCHAAFRVYSDRFRNFSEIVQVWPKCSENTQKFAMRAKEYAFLQTDDEVTIDLMGLLLLLRELEPRLNVDNIGAGVQWIKLLCDYRPVIERVLAYFSLEEKNNQKQHPKTYKAINMARSLWTRYLVLKLFMENFPSDTLEISKFKRLNGVLETDANMKSISSLEKVIKFLKDFDKEISFQLFRDEKCRSCQRLFVGEADTMATAPVNLIPCNHAICTRCYDRAKVDGAYKKTINCPACSSTCSTLFDPIANEIIRNNREFRRFRRCCNSFFMEVVSQLCFSEGTPPSDEVVDKLMSFITMKTRDGKQVTKELNIYDDGVDSTPVVRSFLLQLLMQTSKSNVYEHLSRYFQRALHFLRTPKNKDQTEIINLCLLVVQCMEDAINQQFLEEDKKMIHRVTAMLEESTACLCVNNDKPLDNLHHIAQTRFALGVAASFMFKVYGENSLDINQELRRMFEMVGKLCDKGGSPWPIRYLVKYICRNYGKDCYQTIISECDVTLKRWICPPELKRKEVEISDDRFLTCGTRYSEMREEFSRAAQNEDANSICQLLKGSELKWKTGIIFNLVVFRKFSMDYLFPEDQMIFSNQLRESLQRTFLSCKDISDKDLVSTLLTNTVWKHDSDRNIHLGMHLREQGLSCLLAHCMILFRVIPGKQTLLSPLLNIALHPEQMSQSFFPTMPQDDMDVIRQAINAAKGHENPTFYRCPNGHPYLIGDCGRAWEANRCKEPGCGLPIGGRSHVLTENNIKDDGKDKTDTGHILGEASNRSISSFPERSLRKENCAVMKLVLHMAMYTGANHNRTAVCHVIKPVKKESKVTSFLMEHIRKDLAVMSAVLGKSVEDVLILMHQLLTNIMDNHGENVKCNDDICFLRSKEARAQWEDDFNRQYIVPLLGRSDDVILNVNKEIMKDEGFGSDPLVQLMFETEKPINSIGSKGLCDNPKVWNFRERISLEHIKRTFMKSQQNCPILLQFLEEEQFLRVIRFVPNIIRLQRLLIQKYSRRLDKSEANELTMDKVLQDFDDSRLHEVITCWNDFREAWESVRHHLESYGLPVNGNFVDVPKDMCKKKFDDKTSVSYILPTYRDNGLCSYALLFFLLEKQNLFLQKYCNLNEIGYNNLPKVHVRDVSAAHLISYHPDKDLLPMVLANCKYSFQVGQGTKVEYDFPSLERHVVDRYLFTKSVILLHECDIFVFHSEITNAVVFYQLREKLEQERISQSVLGRVQTELQKWDYPELCSSMDKLNIAISFLKSVGMDGEQLLKDFLVNNLKIGNPFVSLKALHGCKCKHVQSLWLQLAMEKTRRLERSQKESFDGVSSALKLKLSNEQMDTLRRVFKKLKKEQLAIFLEMLFECILLTIDIPPKDAESVDMSRVMVKDALSQFFYDSPYAGDLQQPHWMEPLLEGLTDLDDDQALLCSHVVETWIIVYNILREKEESDEP